MTNSIIVGYSGHAYVVIETAMDAGFKVIGYLDKQIAAKNPFDISYLGFEGDSSLDLKDNKYFLFLGIGENEIRRRAYLSLKDLGLELPFLVHPAATVSTSASIGEGSFVSSGSQIKAFAKIGKGVIINTSAVVEHECEVGDFSHCAPSSTLAGNVKVGKRCFIGANSVVKEGVTIGNDVVIGAGSVIIRDVAEGKRIIGNPGRLI